MGATPVRLRWPLPASPPVAYFPEGSLGMGVEGLAETLGWGPGPGSNNHASSAVSRRRQSALPGTPRRIRATAVLALGERRRGGGVTSHGARLCAEQRGEGVCGEQPLDGRAGTPGKSNVFFKKEKTTVGPSRTR